MNTKATNINKSIIEKYFLEKEMRGRTPRLKRKDTLHAYRVAANATDLQKTNPPFQTPVLTGAGIPGRFGTLCFAGGRPNEAQAPNARSSRCSSRA